VNCHEDFTIKLTSMKGATRLDDGAVDEGVVELDCAVATGTRGGRSVMRSNRTERRREGEPADFAQTLNLENRRRAGEDEGS
jgi:hypothetical protein